MSRRLTITLVGGIIVAACGSEKKAPTQPVCTVSGVTINPNSITVPVSQSTTLAANIAQQNCGSLTPSWSSSNLTVASVSAAGVVSGLAQGTSTITATVNGMQGTAQVTVSACVTALTLNTTALALAVPATGTLTATLTPANCPGATVTWTSAAPAVATVNNGTVTAVSPGSTTITATVGVLSSAATVTVTAPQLGAVWDASNLRVAGGNDAPTGFIAAAWAASPTDIFVNAYPFCYRFNGTSWSKVTGDPFGVEAMWGGAAADVFGVGQLIKRFNGTAWVDMTSPTTQRLRAVWGSSATNVFAVGQGGTIIRYDGTSWSIMSSPTTANLVGVSGSGPNLVFAVAETGEILQFNGTSWTMAASPTSNFLTGIWMVSPTLGYAVGQGGVFKFNGTTWSIDASFASTSAIPRAVWGSAPTNVVIVGDAGLISRFDGTSWSAFARQTARDLTTIVGSGSTSFAFGGNVALQQSGTTSTLLSSAPDLHAVWAIDANAAFAVGDDGTIWKYTSGTWQLQSTGTLARFSGVWAASTTQALAVGVDPLTNAAVSFRYDGSNWQSVSVAGSDGLVAIWGTSFTNLIAGSRFGPLRRFNGSSWSSASAANPGDLSALWGTSDTDYLLVGSGGFAAQFNGSNVSPVATATSRALTSVWGSSPTNYFIGTNGSDFFRFNGTTLTPMSLPAQVGAIYGLWGTGPTQVFAVDFSGTVIRFDGTQWTTLRPSDGTSNFNALHGVATRLFAVGNGGALMVTR